MKKLLFPILALILALGLVVSTATPALAGDTGWQNPTNDTGAFTTPTNAYADGGNNASATNTQVHQYYGYNFSSIPAGATINGIEVRLDAWRQMFESGSIAVELSWNGTDWTTTGYSQSLTWSEQTYIIGGASDKWGHTPWTQAELANLRVRLTVTTNTTVYLDWVPVRVTYNEIGLNPNAGGDSTQLLLGGSSPPATNWEACQTSNGDTSYVSTTNAGWLADLYNLDDTTLSGTITSVTVYMEARRLGGSYTTQPSAQIAIRTHDTNYYGGTSTTIGGGTTETLTQNYAPYSITYNTNPNTTSAWIWDEVNSLQAGVALRKANSGGSAKWSGCTHVWVVVDYTPSAGPADRVFTGTGNFSNATLWDGGTLPLAGENLIILNGCTFDNAADDTLTYGTLTLGQGTTPGTVDWTSSKILKVTDVSSAFVGGAIDMTGGGTLQIGGAFTLDANLTFTSGSGTVVFNGAGAQTIPHTTLSYPFNHLATANGGTKTMGDVVIVNGNLTIGASTTLDTAGNSLFVGGNWTNNGGFTHGNGTVTLGGSSAQNIGGSNATSFYNLIIDNINSPVTADFNFNIAGTLGVNVNAGSVLQPAAGVVINDGGAASTINGGGTIMVTRTDATADYLSQYKFLTNNLGGMTVVYAGTGAQTVNATSAVGNYGGLATSGTGTKTLGGDVTVIGVLSIAGLTTLDVSGSNYGLTVGGNWLNDGTFNAQSGTVTFNATGGIYGSLDPTFNYLNINGGTRTLFRDVTVNGDLAISGASATLDVSASDYALTVKGNWINVGTFNPRNGTVTLNGSSPQNMTGVLTTFYNLTLDNSNGLTIANDEAINHVLTLTNGNITTGVHAVIITASASVSRTSGHVVGNLQMYVGTGAALVTFEVGTASGYDPVSVQFGDVTGVNYLTASATAGDHSQIGSSTIDPTKSVNVNWSFTDFGITFDNYSATFNFNNPGDIDGIADPSKFIVGKWDGATWTYPTVGTKTSTSTEITGEAAFSDFAVGEKLNTPPVMTDATITSSDDPDAYETSTLTASGTATDPDLGDTLSYEYDWWVGGISTGQTTQTLGGTHFNKGDMVTCWIRAYDGTAYSGWMESNTIVIENSPPVANDDDYNVKMNSALHIAAPGVLGNDSDADGDPLDLPHHTPAHHGTATMWADGHFNYVPLPDFTGYDYFTYYASDGTDESVATVNLYVEDYPVYNLNRGTGFYTIMEGIDDADPGDTIMVAGDTYHEVLFIEKSLTLQSEDGAATTIIEDGPDHIIISLEDTGEMVVLDGFTVTGADNQIGITKVDNGSSLTIKNCIIHGGAYGILSYGTTVEDSSTVNIENNEISNNDIGIYFGSVVDGSTVNITGNTVSENSIYGIGFGGVSASCTVNIIGNNITNNAGVGAGGIYFDTGVDFTKVSVNFNNIFGNVPFGIYNNGAGELDAENNWWDDADASGPFDPEDEFGETTEVPPCDAVSGAVMMNFDGTGDAVGGNVDYCPWLGAQLENVTTESITGGDPYTVSLDSVLTVTGTTNNPVTIILSEYTDNPHPEAGGLPSNMLPGYFDIWVSDPSAINWTMYVKQSYDDADVAAAGIDESSLRMHYFTAGLWQECSDTDVDTGANFIWANMTQVEVSGSPVSSGGFAPAGGGGGGGALLIRPKVTGLLAAPLLELEPNGVIPVGCRLKTANSALTLYIAKGTKMLDSAGEPLELLSAVPEPSPPPPPSVIILAYNLGQSGATFSPPITITFSYDPTKLPEGVAAEDLYIAYWDGSAWVPLATEINTMEREASCQTGHFTTFALIAPVSENTPPAPAAFSTSNLSIQPLEVQPQEAVTVTLSVANTGGTEGSYSVVLMIDGAKETERSVTVAAGGSQSVSFSLAREEAGSYSIAVDKLTGSFTVAAASSSTSPPEAKTPISWWIWVIVGVVVVGLIVFFLVRSRAY